MKLQVGKKYKNRMGDVVMVEPLKQPYIFVDDQGDTYTENGVYCVGGDSSFDLVEEYTEPATEKLLSASELIPGVVYEVVSYTLKEDDLRSHDAWIGALCILGKSGWVDDIQPIVVQESPQGFPDLGQYMKEENYQTRYRVAEGYKIGVESTGPNKMYGVEITRNSEMIPGEVYEVVSSNDEFLSSSWKGALVTLAPYIVFESESKNYGKIKPIVIKPSPASCPIAGCYIPRKENAPVYRHRPDLKLIAVKKEL